MKAVGYYRPIQYRMTGRDSVLSFGIPSGMTKLLMLLNLVLFQIHSSVTYRSTLV